MCSCSVAGLGTCDTASLLRFSQGRDRDLILRACVMCHTLPDGMAKGSWGWGGISCAITRLQFDCPVCVCIKNLEVNQHLVYNLKSAGIFCPREWRRCAVLRSSVTGDMSHGAGHVLAGGHWATLGTIGATVLQLWHWGTSIFKESISKHLLHIKRN